MKRTVHTPIVAGAFAAGIQLMLTIGRRSPKPQGYRTPDLSEDDQPSIRWLPLGRGSLVAKPAGAPSRPLPFMDKGFPVHSPARARRTTAGSFAMTVRYARAAESG